MDTNKATHDSPTEVPAIEENTPKTWGRRELLKALGKIYYQVVYPAPGTTTAMLLPRKLLHFTEQ